MCWPDREAARSAASTDALERCGTSPAEMSDRALAYLGLAEPPSAIACLEQAYLAGVLRHDNVDRPGVDPIRACSAFVDLVKDRPCQANETPPMIALHPWPHGRDCCARFTEFAAVRSSQRVFG